VSGAHSGVGGGLGQGGAGGGSPHQSGGPGAGQSANLQELLESHREGWLHNTGRLKFICLLYVSEMEMAMGNVGIWLLVLSCIQ